jgi:hypothetical protein
MVRVASGGWCEVRAVRQFRPIIDRTAAGRYERTSGSWRPFGCRLDGGLQKAIVHLHKSTLGSMTAPNSAKLSRDLTLQPLKMPMLT